MKWVQKSPYLERDFVGREAGGRGQNGSYVKRSAAAVVTDFRQSRDLFAVATALLSMEFGGG